MFKGIIFLICINFGAIFFAQNGDSIYYKDLVQFTGIVVSHDSIEPVPYVNIIDITRRVGTIADNHGYFSFVAQKGDSIKFSSIGYKPSYFVISDTLKYNRYSLIHIMEPDTILLAEAIIYPWPSREQFENAFLSLDLPKSDQDRAEENLNEQKLAEFALNMPMDGNLNYKQQMIAYQNKVYYAGQYAPISLLNPVAWSQFIKAWKNGSFKP